MGDFSRREALDTRETGHDELKMLDRRYKSTSSL